MVPFIINDCGGVGNGKPRGTQGALHLTVKFGILCYTKADEARANHADKPRGQRCNSKRGTLFDLA